MRLHVLLDSPRPVRVPLDHQGLLAGAVYTILGIGDAEYARFLHQEGYAEANGMRRLKLFVFSTLRIPARQREREGAYLRIAPGRLSWYLSSPVSDFLQHEVGGLLSVGSELRVGTAIFRLTGIEALPEPTFGDSATFTCLTPVVAAVPSSERETAYYLRPTDADAFSEAVRRNLLLKYGLLHGGPPPDDTLRLAFDADYLARAPHGGTKKVRIHTTDIVGVQAPLTLTGSPDLIRTAWECGLGEKNSMGFGMLDLVR